MSSSARRAVSLVIASCAGAALGLGIYVLSLPETPIYDSSFRCPQPSPQPTMPWAMSSCAGAPIGNLTGPVIWSDAVWFLIGGLVVGLVMGFVAVRYVAWVRDRVAE